MHESNGIVAPEAASPRPAAASSIATIFAELAGLQQQLVNQVEALEASLGGQRQELANVLAQIPEMREKINWLITSFYEQGKKDEIVRERLDRQDETFSSLTEAVRGLCAVQAHWKSAIDQVIEILQRAQSAELPQHPDGRPQGA